MEEVGEPHVHCHTHSGEDNHDHEHVADGVYKHCHEHDHSESDNHEHGNHFEGKHSHCHTHRVKVEPYDSLQGEGQPQGREAQHHHEHQHHEDEHHHDHAHNHDQKHHAHHDSHEHEHSHGHSHGHNENHHKDHDHRDHDHHDDAHAHAHGHGGHDHSHGGSCSHDHAHGEEKGEEGYGMECPVGDESCQGKTDEVVQAGNALRGCCIGIWIIVSLIVGEETWRSALLGTVFITLGGNSAILLFYWWTISDAALRVMVLFAVGGLLGDVFLHLLPHALEATAEHDNGHHHAHGHGHGHGHEHSHDMSVGLAVIAGILSFFLVEKVLRAIHGGHGHSHSGKAEEKRSGIQPGAVLNMVADAAHNFTDGMAIAAAYQVSRSTGTVMTVAVFFHEIPHEVGDFAVLLKQGMSRKQAFLAQFVSAIGALLGCLFGLSVQSAQPTLVLSFTAGGFIYVSLVNIVPDVLDHPSGVVESLQQVLGKSRNEISRVFFLLLLLNFSILRRRLYDGAHCYIRALA